ncbi:hypothetical protein OPIT5_03985 [Opitutaceae bacterium TAV5]|nr:hypothetical protein OPIT5_03985 [Opitutaceae bacterium TAV5]
MSTVIFAPDRKGFVVSGEGVLATKRRENKGLRYMRGQMYEHLEEAAKRYYGGETAAIDDFFQLYSIGEEERKKAKAKLTEGGAQ